MDDIAQLVRFDRAGCWPGCGTVVAIHDDGSDAEDLLVWCTKTAARWNVCAPQAPRSRDPFRTGGASEFGVLAKGSYQGFEWTRKDPDGSIDPSSLGDSLVELAALLVDVRRRDAERPIVLLGEGVGGALARLLASRTPIVLAATISIDPVPVSIRGFDADGIPRGPFFESAGRHAAAGLLGIIDRGEYSGTIAPVTTS